MDIKEALAALDKGNDNHWTQGGLPRLETVRLLVADPNLSREQVEAGYPGFTRNGVVELQVEAKPLEAAQNVAAAPLQPTAQPQYSLEDLEEYLQHAQAQLEEAKRLAEEAKARVEECTKVCDDIIDARTVAQGETNKHDVITAYLQSRQQAYADRAEQLQKMRGIDLRALVPQRSALDVAISSANVAARRQGK